jgi:alpha-tubulin suppressor-like RCC1 family protein
MGQGFTKDKVKKMGDEKFKEGDFEYAALWYSKVLQQEKSNYLVQANRWLAYLKNGQFGYAYEDAIKVLKIKPDFVKAHYRLGLVYEKMELLYESYMSIKRAWELDSFQSQDLIEKMNEVKKRIEAEYVFKGRPSILMWGTNEKGCWGIGVKQKKLLTKLTSVEDLQGIDISDLACGVSHSIAVNSNSEAFVWGLNSYSQWGMASVGQECFPNPVFLKSLNSQKIMAVAWGAAHTLVTTNVNVVYSWGMNTMGQCGVDSEEKCIAEPTQVKSLLAEEIQGVACGMAHSFFLTREGDLFCWGWNSNGQLGYGKTDVKLTKPHRLYLSEGEKFNYVAWGGCHTIMITKENGRVYATGLNSWSQLGLGTDTDEFTPQKIVSLTTFITYASCGEEFTLLISPSGQVFSWGLNNVGQWGHPISTPTISTPQLVTAIQDEQIESWVWGKGQVLAINSRGTVFKWGSENENSSEDFQPKILTYFKNKEVLHISSGREFFGILVAATDPKKSFATGKILNSSLKAGKKGVFEIITIDKTGFMRTKGGDRVNVFGIDQLSGKIINPAEVHAFDLQNGRYEVELKVRQSGKFLMHVLINGQSIQMSPFTLHIKPGEPDPKKWSISFMPYNNFKSSDPPEYKMIAGETLFFKIKFLDYTGAEIDELDDFNHSRIIIKKNGAEALSTEIKWELILSEYGDHEIKATFFNADTQNIKVYLDSELLMFHIDLSVIAKVQGKQQDNIVSQSLFLDVAHGYARSSKCTVEAETFKRLPFKDLDEIRDCAVRAGKEESFIVIFRDEFGNTAPLLKNQLIVEIVNKENGIQIQDVQINDFGDCRKKITFQIKQPDEYQISIKIGDQPIHPAHWIFAILVIHGLPDFAWTKVLNKDECFEGCDISKSEIFSREIAVQARDQFGNYWNYTDWENEIKCTITYIHPKISKTEDHSPEYMVDKKDPSIAYFKLEISKPGGYKINIQADSFDIFGSPFLCTFGCTEEKFELERKKQLEEEELRRLEGNSTVIFRRTTSEKVRRRGSLSPTHRTREKTSWNWSSPSAVKERARGKGFRKTKTNCWTLTENARAGERTRGHEKASRGEAEGEIG